jgi:anti-sigma B factor antagonist
MQDAASAPRTHKQRLNRKTGLEAWRTVGFRVRARQTEGVTVMDIAGSITLAEASELSEMIHDLVGKGRKQIIVNLRDVEYLDSSGIGQLVSGYATVKKNGGELRILHLSKKVQDLLSVTSLYKIFEEFPDEQSAVRSFRRT